MRGAVRHRENSPFIFLARGFPDARTVLFRQHQKSYENSVAFSSLVFLASHAEAHFFRAARVAVRALAPPFSSRTARRPIALFSPFLSSPAAGRSTPPRRPIHDRKYGVSREKRKPAGMRIRYVVPSERLLVERTAAAERPLRGPFHLVALRASF